MKRHALLVAGLPALGGAHDIWIEPSIGHFPLGRTVDLSLMLGNHGNGHRDFKLASKVSAGDRSLVVYGPRRKEDLTSELVDQAMDSPEGFWKASFYPREEGFYCAASRFDRVMSYAPVRDIKSAKTFFRVDSSFFFTAPNMSVPLGHALEIVPLAGAFRQWHAMKVRILYQGKPLSNTRVSFIPRGARARGDFDRWYERMTDARGEAEMVLSKPTTYLIAAHLTDEKAKGKGYESIHYSATLCVNVESASR